MKHAIEEIATRGHTIRERSHVLDYILVDRANSRKENAGAIPCSGIEIGNPVEDHGAVGLESTMGVEIKTRCQSMQVPVDWTEVGKEENAMKVTRADCIASRSVHGKWISMTTCSLCKTVSQQFLSQGVSFEEEVGTKKPISLTKRGKCYGDGSCG